MNIKIHTNMHIATLKDLEEVANRLVDIQDELKNKNPNVVLDVEVETN